MCLIYNLLKYILDLAIQSDYLGNKRVGVHNALYLGITPAFITYIIVLQLVQVL